MAEVSRKIEHLRGLERTYKRRAEYCLLALLFVILPLASQIDDEDGGFHIKSGKTLLRDFGEVGYPLFIVFAVGIVIVGAINWYRLKKTSRARCKEEWGI